VALYKEGAFEAALVEFVRANELSPNPRTLYNIAQVQLALLRFAHAKRAFERFLAESKDLTPTKRAEVQAELARLGDRVGYLEISVDTPGAEIRIDREVIGHAPLTEPVAVAIGERRVVALVPGRAPVERVVPVAAGDHVRIELSAPAAERRDARQIEEAPPASVAPTPGSAEKTGRRHRRVLWASAGVTAGLGAAALATGALTLTTSRALDTELDSFPGDAERMDRLRRRGDTLSQTTDVLLALTVVGAGVTGVLWLTAPTPPTRDRRNTTGLPHSAHPAPSRALLMGPGGIRFRQVF
jgi:hypothetical protein